MNYVATRALSEEPIETTKPFWPTVMPRQSQSKVSVANQVTNLFAKPQTA